MYAATCGLCRAAQGRAVQRLDSLLDETEYSRSMATRSTASGGRLGQSSWSARAARSREGTVKLTALAPAALRRRDLSGGSLFVRECALLSPALWAALCAASCVASQPLSPQPNSRQSAPKRAVTEPPRARQPASPLEAAKPKTPESPPQELVYFCGQQLDTTATTVRCSRDDLTDLIPLARLRQLRLVEISDSPVTDLAPLGGLEHLEGVRLTSMPLVHVSPLGTLPRLKELDLSQTRVTDLAPLASAPALEVLSLDGTPVVDVTPLGEVTTLKFISLAFTQVRDVSPLKTLSKLHTLSLDSAPVSRISPLSVLPELDYIDISGTKVPTWDAIALQKKRPKLEIRRIF
jgi:hypothetical protein